TLTGSLANYNYSDESDLDVHILMDYSQIADDQELVRDYLNKKNSNLYMQAVENIVSHERNHPEEYADIYELRPDW
ncbi:MAG: hypothetical protein ACK4M7_01210, partial [Burkholderiales bacterium]